MEFCIMCYKKLISAVSWFDEFSLRDGEPKLILTCATANAEMRGILDFDKTCFLQCLV